MNSVVTVSLSIQEARKTPISCYRQLLKQKATETSGESGGCFSNYYDWLIPRAINNDWSEPGLEGSCQVR